MNRRGNWAYQITLRWPLHLVHRGVVEGGKKLSPEARERFWEKHSLNKKEEIDFSYDNVVAGESISISVCLDVLQMMREKHLVIVCDIRRPRVWTPVRIKKFGRRVDGLDAASATDSVSGVFVRRGGLELGQLSDWPLELLPKTRRWQINRRSHVGG